MLDFEALTPEQIIEAERLFATVVVPVMTEEHADEDGRAGAVLDLRSTFNEVLLHCRSGEAPEDKFLSYEENATAKNDALEADENLLASWEVHQGDISQKPYPGAIRTMADDRVSISGFTWQRDTIGSLWLAHKLGRMGVQNASEIATLCGIRLQFLEVWKKLNAACTQMARAA